MIHIQIYIFDWQYYDILLTELQSLRYRVLKIMRYLPITKITMSYCVVLIFEGVNEDGIQKLYFTNQECWFSCPFLYFRETLPEVVFKTRRTRESIGEKNCSLVRPWPKSRIPAIEHECLAEMDDKSLFITI